MSSSNLASSSSSSSSFLARMVFNSLPGRFGRAACQTLKNGALLPVYLSPWGDGSPVEVPNVRKRDIALFPLVTPWEVGDQVLGITAKKEDAYLSEIVDLSGDDSMLQTGHGHHFLAKLPLKPAPWLPRTPEDERVTKLLEQLIPLSRNVARSGSVCTIRARIRHRFVDEAAQLRFHGENPNASWTWAFGTSKGWFAPYFHATNRSPYIPRLKEPLVVLFDGPPLHREGDYALGADLVNTSPWVLDFCKSTLPETAPPNPAFRVAMMLVGIAPPAPLIGWSSSRRPGECLMDFSLPNSTPCILLPASPNTPLIAYDTHTLADVLDPSCTLSESAHAEYLHHYLRLFVDPGALGNERMETYVKRAVECLVGCVRKCGTVMGGTRISARAGIAMFKVPASMVEELDPEAASAVNGAAAPHENGNGNSILEQTSDT